MGVTLQAPLEALVLQTGTLELLSHGTVYTFAVLGVLAFFSILSLAIILSRLVAFSAAGRTDGQFLRAFRASNSMQTALASAESFRPTPLVLIFDYGYGELSHQVNLKGRITSKDAISRSLQVAISEQLLRFEHNLNWLATIASVSPFIGLFGTVMGIVRVFTTLGSAGSTSLTTVGPGVAEALVTTGVGLIAAIPAAIFYNFFGRKLKEMGDRYDNFSLEFLNMIERSTEE